MSLRPRHCVLLVVLALLVTQGAVAQAPPTPPAHPTPPPPPAVDQQQVIAYWTTETGWNSELQLRNNALSQDLTVTPAVRLANGAETSLAPLTVKPQEVKSIDIGAAVIAAGAPQFTGTYGSLVLRYHSPSQGVLYAAMMVHRMGYPIAFHIDAMGESREFQAGSREGIWWLPKNSTSDYLILANQGSKPIPLLLSLYDSGGKESRQRLILGAFETGRYSVRKLVQAAGLTGSYGGIKVAAAAHAGSLDTLHFLFDETAGFSAILKMFEYDPATRLEERDYARTGVWTQRAPMLALSNPDPALAFPPGTTLHPQLLVRNTTGKPADAALRFNWRTASSTGPAAGPALHLNPHETRLVDVAALQAAGILPKEANWTSVTLTTKGLPDEVVAVAASYDPSLRYGAQTPFSDQLTFKWEGGMWEYDPYHDSIITAGNGGTKPTRAAFTIFYNQGAQRYDLEQTLQPDEQMWIDVGKLIREHVQDKNGNALPADLTTGSYEFRDLTNIGVGTLFEGKVIYDKTYGHVVYGCGSCCGYKAGAKVYYDPIGVPMSGTSVDGVNAYDTCSQIWDDVSGAFFDNWTSANHSIATVDGVGTHTGMGVGSTTSGTHGYLQSTRIPNCPNSNQVPGGGVNVKMPTVTIDSFTPNPVVKGNTANVHVTINPSAPVLLTITRSGTGTATFGTSGNTTITIPDTTTVNVLGGAESNGSADLTLTASYAGSPKATINFSVTAGTCTATYSAHGGDGLKNCPTQVNVYDTYNLKEYCSGCSFSCAPTSFDGTFTHISCSPSTGGIQGAGNQVLTSTETGNFAATDCNYHNVQIKTTITNALGGKTDYVGGNAGLKCNKYPNGSPCP